MTNKWLLRIIIVSLVIANLLLLAIFFTLPPKEEHQLGSTKNLPDYINIDSETKHIPSIINRKLTLHEQIQEYLRINALDSDQIAYTITDLDTNQKYGHNSNLPFRAASIYKLPLAMLFYDLINQDVYDDSTAFLFQEHQYEEGGVLEYNYEIGSMVPLSYLLDVVVVASDNSAGHILYQNYGGWFAYKEDTKRCSSNTDFDGFMDYENLMTTAYTNDILIYLYQHLDEYELLLGSMQQSYPKEYLNATMNYSTYQKHGNYAEAMGAIGLNLEDHPYAISILSSLGPNAEIVLGEINQIVYNYFNPQ